nr:MAG TPA: hypothetical protein [Caudoviricetes sp.]
MKFLRVGLLLGDEDIEEFIIDASQIILVTEDAIGDNWCVKVELKDLEGPYYFTHIYTIPFFEEIGSIYNFYNALEKLSA